MLFRFSNAEFYGLPLSFTLHPSRRFFYRLNWTPKTLYDAGDSCIDGRYDGSNDGSYESYDQFDEERFLGTPPIPLSQEENDQIAELMDGLNIWLGIWPSSHDDPDIPDHWTAHFEAWGVPKTDGKMDFTNWRSDDMAKPDLSSGTQKIGAIISGTDRKWETRDENEMHYSMCIFRF